jgi:hypothetical protein
LVNAKYLESEPTKTVSDNLKNRAGFAWSSVHSYVPEVELQDFRAEFRALDVGNKRRKNVPGIEHYIFAEFKDGKLIMH